MIDISVVIVNYNNDGVLRGCLPALLSSLEGIDAEVLLSDNGSTDGSLPWVRSTYPSIQVIENKANLGFAEGNNRALPLTTGRYVLLLNPDTVVEPDSIAKMITFLDTKPQAGVVSCKLINGDGSRQISARRYPTLLTYFLSYTGLSLQYQDSPFFGQFNMTDWDGDSERQVDWACGAVLMVRRKTLEKVGGLDPYFFLTYDEVDWCRRIKKAGFEVWYTPCAVIQHLDRQSEPQANPKPEARIKYMTVERNSRTRYFLKHRGRVYMILVELLHIALAAGLLLKMNLLGTRRAPVYVMELKLLIIMNLRTLRRLPRVIGRMLIRLLGGSQKWAKMPLLINPYLVDDN